ncbi:hypothetical protein [Ureibacillus manganicus]|uniref:Membrane protein n=1 Tax=Ureibacillus manganicus DSM 26584 TaxID=1384049 RepID=A0A0A3HZ72_9BACL|nr:hypothetical protein [Ureibacillus manganicus]KGR77871.1 membrane protein [Ureibacillus manganicus DSM 26584]
MNLIDVYINEVTRRLPEKNREDIGLELRSTIEDMLPEDSTEQDIKVVLNNLGNPAVLASNYSEKPMHLIGPRYYDVYVSLLKMILPIAAVVAIISLLAENIFNYNEDQAFLSVALMVLGKGIWLIIEVFIQTFFWLTIVFAIIERVDNTKDLNPLSFNGKKWTPEDLKSVAHVPRKKAVSNGYVFFSLLWTAIWVTVYFNADHLLGVYQKGENGLQFVMPALNQPILNAYWPVVIICVVLEVALALFMLFKKQWTKNIALLNVVKELVGTISVIVIITNVAIFNQEFIVYMSDLLNLNENAITGYIQWLTIIVYPIFAIWNCIDGYLKAKIN